MTRKPLHASASQVAPSNDLPLTGDNAPALEAGRSELFDRAEFLCARLRDLEGYDGDELLRQLMGHVLPALARMEMALAKAVSNG